MTDEGGDLPRDLAAQEDGRIVVGVDGSAPSVAALRWAAGMAARTGWSLDVVMTWQFPLSYGLDGGAAFGFDWQSDTEKALAALVDEVFGPHRPRGLRTRVVEGDAAHTLIKQASDAQMLVVGSRGKGGFKGLLLGSVSTKCAAHATCPVLVVHWNDTAPALTVRRER